MLDFNTDLGDLERAAASSICASQVLAADPKVWYSST
jgi:hypothetical protein